jgi:ferredoxin
MPKVIFIERNGTPKEVDASEGDTLLEIAHANNVDIEGACEGCMACSTCHLILEPDWYKKVPAPSEDEEDMMDLAFGLTKTSRLGCQITMTADLDGLTVRLPKEVRNMLG